jgi:hypothetical protein
MSTHDGHAYTKNAHTNLDREAKNRRLFPMTPLLNATEKGEERRRRRRIEEL